MIPRFLSAGFVPWFCSWEVEQREQRDSPFVFAPSNEQGDGNKRTVPIFDFLCDSIVINRLL